MTCEGNVRNINGREDDQKIIFFKESRSTAMSYKKEAKLKKHNVVLNTT